MYYDVYIVCMHMYIIKYSQMLSKYSHLYIVYFGVHSIVIVGRTVYNSVCISGSQMCTIHGLVRVHSKCVQSEVICTQKYS